MKEKLTKNNRKYAAKTKLLLVVSILGLAVASAIVVPLSVSNQINSNNIKTQQVENQVGLI
jgi:uncharacterized membrane protein YwzB